MQITFLFIGMITMANILHAQTIEELKSDLNTLQQDLSGLNSSLQKIKSPVPSGTTFITQKGIKVHVVDKDITTMQVNAIVNAANKALPQNPSGVAAVIWKAANSDALNKWIKNNLTKNNGVYIQLGHAQSTPSFNLKTTAGIDYIIHAVGPNCNQGESVSKIYDAHKNSLIVANQLKIKSIAFPPISTGIFGCDRKQAAQNAIKAIAELDPSKTTVTDVYITTFKGPEYRKAVLEELNKVK